MECPVWLLVGKSIFSSLNQPDLIGKMFDGMGKKILTDTRGLEVIKIGN